MVLVGRDTRRLGWRRSVAPCGEDGDKIVARRRAGPNDALIGTSRTKKDMAPGLGLSMHQLSIASQLCPHLNLLLHPIHLNTTKHPGSDQSDPIPPAPPSCATQHTPTPTSDYRLRDPNWQSSRRPDQARHRRSIINQATRTPALANPPSSNPTVKHRTSKTPPLQNPRISERAPLPAPRPPPPVSSFREGALLI